MATAIVNPMRKFLLFGTLILSTAARASSITPQINYFSFGNLSETGGGRYAASFEVFGEAVNDSASDFDLVAANIILPPFVSYDVQFNPLGTVTIPAMSTYSGSLGLFEVSFGPGGLNRNVDQDVSAAFTLRNGIGGDVDSVYITAAGIIPAQPVPEPASFAALGLGAIALLRRRRK